MPVFLTEDQWKTADEMEAVPRDASMLTTTCQNENKLNTCCGPVMRNALHGRLSSGALNEIDSDAWSKNKKMIRPKKKPFQCKFSHTHRKSVLE